MELVREILACLVRRAALIASVVAMLGLAVAVPSAGAAAHSSRGHHHRKHHHHHAAGKPASAQQAAAPAPASSASAGCAAADIPATAASLADMRAAVFCLVNQQRTSRGLPALTESDKLDSSAQSWTTWMVSNGQFTHGTNFAGRISGVGYDWQTAGENIATGYDTPRSVVQAWMASTDHCRNILDPSFRNVGTGVVAQPVGDYASDPSTWTQDFGLVMIQSPLSGNQGPMNGCPYNV